jgi:Zinc finger, C2H2 type/Zinc-finger of C2H2 type
MAEPQIIPHKIKAEWTKSSSSEVFTSSSEISSKIHIIEQIIIPSTNKVAKKLNRKLKSEDSKSIKCQICEKSFMNATVYQEHKTTHENKFFECSEENCTKKFKRKSSLRKHSYFHKGKFKYSCEICKEKFIDKCKYQVHLASKHNKIQTLFECKTCKKTFTSADYLRKHQVTHNGTQTYT